MKVLQINNLYKKFGGAESVFFNTIELLTQRNHEVIPFSLSGENNEPSKYLSYFVNKDDKLHNKLYSFLAKNQIENLVRKEKPDIAHIHNIIGGLTFSILPVLREYNVPVVATLHDFRLFCPVYVFLDNKNNICEKCKKGNYLNCFINNCSGQGYVKSLLLTSESYFRDIFIPYSKFIDSFIAVSNFVKTKILEVHPELEKKTTTIYNFSRRFSQHNHRGNYFLYFGRLSREKGLLNLLKAFKELKELQLVIVGDGELRKQLEDEKSTNVDVIGYKTGIELEKIINNSFFVIASSECYETNSMVIVESYSSGKPVIGAKIGAIPELIIEDKTGFLFDSKNIDSLVKILSYSATISESQYENMGNNAFEFAKEKFSANQHYDLLQNVYKHSILSTKSI